MSKSESHRGLLFENRQNYLKNEVKRALGGAFNPANLQFSDFSSGLDDAVARAKAMDVNKEDRWPQELGTRVYRVIEKIKQLIT